jgi:hypothetical protein
MQPLRFSGVSSDFDWAAERITGSVGNYSPAPQAKVGRCRSSPRDRDSKFFCFLQSGQYFFFRKEDLSFSSEKKTFLSSRRVRNE